MSAKSLRAIFLIWAMLSQPLLSLASLTVDLENSSGSTHDHSAHDHSSIEDFAVGMVSDNNSFTSSEHDHHPSIKSIATHDCGPCINGDMSHCQCSAIMHMTQVPIFQSYPKLDLPLSYSPVLVAHSQSLFRPPILA